MNQPPSNSGTVIIHAGNAVLEVSQSWLIEKPRKAWWATLKRTIKEENKHGKQKARP